MRIDRRTTIIACALSLSLVPIAASGAAQSDEGADPTVSLAGTEWQLTRMAARGPWDMTIGFGPDGTLAGATPCFALEGRYATQGDRIEIDAAKVADSEGNDVPCDILQETGGDLLLQALDDAQGWTVDTEGILSIIPASGMADFELTLELLMEPEPAVAPASETYVGSWTLAEVIAQTGEPTPLPEGLAISLTFDDAGAIGGSAGCGAYAGSYAFDEFAEMTISDLAVEEVVECDPMFAMWQQEYVRLLESVDELSTEGERLVLGTDPWGFDLIFDAAD